MKPVFQAVLFLGLVTPSFSAVPVVDFDGRNKANENPVNFFNETSMSPQIPLANPKTSPPEMVRKGERLTENGEFVEIIPEVKLNEPGKKCPHIIYSLIGLSVGKYHALGMVLGTRK